MTLRRYYLFIITILCLCPLWAHEKKEHDEILKKVLFGENVKLSQTTSNSLDILNAGCYLSIDYFNDSLTGVQCRRLLSDYGVRNLPGLTSINYSCNYLHEKYTHLGWNHYYGNSDKGSWKLRKELLINTVDALCKFKKNEQKQKEAFSAFCYYIHVLGDHEHNTDTTRITRLPLTSESGRRPNKSGTQCLERGVPEESNPTVFNDLIFYIGRMFSNQKDSVNYAVIMNFLTKNEDYFLSYDKIDIEEYQKLASDTIEVLQQNIPVLLRNEAFFNRAF